MLKMWNAPLIQRIHSNSSEGKFCCDVACVFYELTYFKYSLLNDLTSFFFNYLIIHFPCCRLLLLALLHFHPPTLPTPPSCVEPADSGSWDSAGGPVPQWLWPWLCASLWLSLTFGAQWLPHNLSTHSSPGEWRSQRQGQSKREEWKI